MHYQYGHADTNKSDFTLVYATAGACSWAARVGAPKLYWMETAPHGVTPAMHGRQVGQ